MAVEEREIDFDEALATQEEGAREQDAAGMTEEITQEQLKEITPRLVPRTGVPPAALDPAEGDPILARTAPRPQAPAPVAGQEDQQARRAAIGADQAEQVSPDPEDEPLGTPVQKEEEPERDPEDILADLGIKSEPRRWVIGEGVNQRSYIQRPLSFVGKIQTFGLLGEVIDKAMSGENPLAINSLFEVPNVPRGRQLTSADFRDAETFIQAIGKIVRYMPDFIERAFAIWLDVPEYEREVEFKELFRLRPEEGGLTDDDQLEIIHVFIDQNWDDLEDFFGNKIRSLTDRVSARQRVSRSRRSKPSSRTAPPTQSG